MLSIFPLAFPALLLLAAVARAQATCTASCTGTTCVYTGAGASCPFSPPADTTAIVFTVVGGLGGECPDINNRTRSRVSDDAASVSGRLLYVPGQTLIAYPGGNGEDCSTTPFGFPSQPTAGGASFVSGLSGGQGGSAGRLNTGAAGGSASAIYVNADPAVIAYGSGGSALASDSTAPSGTDSAYGAGEMADGDNSGVAADEHGGGTGGTGTSAGGGGGGGGLYGGGGGQGDNPDVDSNSGSGGLGSNYFSDFTYDIVQSTTRDGASITVTFLSTPVTLFSGRPVARRSVRVRSRSRRTRRAGRVFDA